MHETWHALERGLAQRAGRNAAAVAMLVSHFRSCRLEQASAAEARCRRRLHRGAAVAKRASSHGSVTSGAGPAAAGGERRNSSERPASEDASDRSGRAGTFVTQRRRTRAPDGSRAAAQRTMRRRSLPAKAGERQGEPRLAGRAPGRTRVVSPASCAPSRWQYPRRVCHQKCQHARSSLQGARGWSQRLRGRPWRWRAQGPGPLPQGSKPGARRAMGQKAHPSHANTRQNDCWRRHHHDAACAMTMICFFFFFPRAFFRLPSRPFVYRRPPAMLEGYAQGGPGHWGSGTAVAGTWRGPHRGSLLATGGGSAESLSSSLKGMNGPSRLQALADTFCFV